MFVVMIILQVFVMPYVMAEKPEHVYFSLTQLYMGIFMGAGMVAVDALLDPTPVWVWFGILAVAGAAAMAYRYQLGITDRGWLREMIPHHSMALVTSRSKLKSLDPFVQRLAEQIIATQRREIGEMQMQLATMPAR
jgi:uncharacterized protein (DUF305 family)